MHITEVAMDPALKKVATLDQIPEGHALAVELEGHKVAIFNVEGELHAVESTCAKHGAPMEKSPVAGDTVYCPWHGATFDIDTATCSEFPDEQLAATYEVVLEGDQVFLRI